MSRAELIAKLTANSVNLEKIGGVSVSLLTKSELAGLLGGLSEQEMNLAMAKYAGDESSKQKLLAHVLAYIVNKGWKASDDLLNTMVVLVVNEVLTENLCNHCKGTGTIISKRFKLLPVICKNCDGTRHKIKSGREIAKLLNISNTQWLKVWSSRYNNVLEYVCEMNLKIR